jgi:DUF1009 family protein
MADAEGGAPLAIICGGGSFPGAVADAVVARGRRPVMFGIKGWADPQVIGRYVHHWIAIGQAGRFFRLAQAENCREVLFCGSIGTRSGCCRGLFVSFAAAMTNCYREWRALPKAGACVSSE